MRLLICVGMLAVIAGCGSPGVPQPPELELARPVRDLRAVRKGNEVRLTWTVPGETTDHRAFRHAGPTQICRSVGIAAHECSPVAELPTPESGRCPSSRQFEECFASRQKYSGYLYRSPIAGVAITVRDSRLVLHGKCPQLVRAQCWGFE